MWSIVSSKLLRKPSKRAEGEGEKRTKDGPAKVERRESGRLGSGASKFLRSLRSGNTKESNEQQVNVIALKELDAEKIEGPEGKRTIPERSQSFQEKRFLIPAPLTVSSEGKYGGLTKGKHSRAQSFVSPLGPGPVKGSYTLPGLYGHPNRIESAYAGTKFTPEKTRPTPVSSHPNPCETIYENLETIREQQKEKMRNSRAHKGNSPRSKRSGSYDSGGFSNDDRCPFISLTLDRKPKNLCQQFVESAMTNYEKDRDREKRPFRKLTKDSGYETNCSDYMNIDLLEGGTREEKGGKTGRERARGSCSPSVKPMMPHEVRYSTAVQESRRLRRSISDVPPERITIAKLQTKLAEDSRAIYTSIGNGLSIWSAEKTKVGATGVYGGIRPSGGDFHKKSSVDSSTLPRSSGLPRSTSVPRSPGLSISSRSHSSNYDQVVTAKSSPSLRNPVETPLTTLSNVEREARLRHGIEVTSRRKGSVPNIYESIGQKLCSASSAPNLQQPTLTLPPTEEIYKKKEGKRRSTPPAHCSTRRHKSIPDILPTLELSNEKFVAKLRSESSGLGKMSSWMGQEDGKTGAPVRDSSSLKSIRYGPGHEKYPSWPIPDSSAPQIDPAGEGKKLVVSTGSSRSKSWTDQTDYPKEKPPTYSRPYMKRMNQAFTQQLKTVMERCERAGDGKGGILPPPLRYRDFIGSEVFAGGEKEYNIPSPPERDLGDGGKPLTQEDLELYAKKYEEMMSQYAQSEGYHSYISSECSSYIGSGTPFLDQLRRESEANHQFWSGEDDGLSGPPLIPSDSRSGRDSVTTVVTNSSSNSSGNETLKLGGSASDLSLPPTPVQSIHVSSSPLQARLLEQRLIQQQRQRPNSTLSGKLDGKQSEIMENMMSGKKGRQESPSPNLKKFPLSTYTRPYTSPKNSRRKLTPLPIPSPAQVDSTAQTQTSPIIDTSKPPSVAERIQELEQQSQQQVGNHSKPTPTPQPQLPISNNEASVCSNANDRFAKSSSLNCLREPAVPQSPHQSQRQKRDEKEFWNGFGENGSISYTYLDPDKKHRVADMTLKAIQKKALLSYYERHTGKGPNSPESPNFPQPQVPNMNGSMKEGSGLEKDSPFPSNRLQLSLPPYTGRLREQPTGQVALGPNPGGPQGGRAEETVFVSSSESISRNSSSHSSMTAMSISSTSPSPSNHNESLEHHSKVEKGEIGTVGHFLTSSADEYSNGESARMAYMSKYLPHLNREIPPQSWNGATSVNCAGSVPATGEPVPPERPPKKPHLKNLPQQKHEDECVPPPPLPRNPIKQTTTSAPPVPSKPQYGGMRCLSPDLPPPPPVTGDEVEVVINDPLPPPPTPAEVNMITSKSISASELTSYLHRDSYLAQRKEKTLGYEGRYRRTLSPSGLGSKTADPPRQMSNATSTGKLETTLSPSAWEKYHNIRAPSTTVIFTSHEIPKSSINNKTFNRSLSCDNNLYNNKTGHSQPSVPLPIAQVAPLRGNSVQRDASTVTPDLDKSPRPINDGILLRRASAGNNDYIFLKEKLEGAFGEDGDEGSSDSLMHLPTSSMSASKDSLFEIKSAFVPPLRVMMDNKENVPLKSNKSESNSRVSDAASQTDSSSSSSSKEDEGSSSDEASKGLRRVSSSNSNNSNGSSSSTYKGRQKSQAEIDCEELSRDLAKQLPRGDKLQTLLVPLPKHKTSADYMEGLFPIQVQKDVEIELRDECCEKSRDQVPVHLDQPIDANEQRRCDGQAPLPADSLYFTTSESKAKFLTQYGKDMNKDSPCKGSNGQDLLKQKEELVSRISRKLKILKTEQTEIREEIEANESLGRAVAEKVKLSAKRNEFDKFKLRVEEIDQITSLLLGLSGRLARAENALMCLSENENPQEKKILESKRDKLKEQLDEAKILKESIDRRSAQVSGFLLKYLSSEDFSDYEHFVKMKAKLIIDSREIDDKIKLGDEQLVALQETLTVNCSPNSK